MRLISWNVNGLRAVYKKGFMDWFLSEQPDIVCIQETRAARVELPEAVKAVTGYSMYFAEAERRGYSGVALWSKEKPWSVQNTLGIRRFDNEGRLLMAEYADFILLNVYFPNGKASQERLAFKLDFYDTFLAQAAALKEEGRNIIICGDVNTAHQEIDLARPRENEAVSGFLPEERAWIDRLVAHGFIDTFRMFEQGPGHYSWWDLKSRARERNVGWRIDYFFVSESLRHNISAAFIQSGVMGSDHCPVGIELTLE